MRRPLVVHVNFAKFPPAVPRFGTLETVAPSASERREASSHTSAVAQSALAASVAFASCALSPSTSFARGLTLTFACGSKRTPAASSTVPSRMSIVPFAPHGLRSFSVPPPVFTKLPRFGLAELVWIPGCKAVSISSVAPSWTSKVVDCGSFPWCRWLARAMMREGWPFSDGSTVIGPFSPQPFHRPPPSTP